LPRITRHYLTINGRTVHYRRCGRGPALLMIHQSPRSSKEYEALMQQWSAHFTCIAPDTPGFGQSDPLSKPDPDIDDYADAVVEFARGLGVHQIAAYGFHSGGIILVTALRRHPDFFTGLAIGGYAIWTPQEMAVFGDAYLPPFRPSAYGEHLTWLWNRVLEQSWFFPWFDVRREARLSVAHDDALRVHAVVMEMLDAGDAYRLGYGAVLRAPRDIPLPDAITPPVLITAYDGDPLQAHIDRLGEMPAGWKAEKLSSPKEHQDSSLAFLRALSKSECPALAQDDDRGFMAVTTADFDGLLHWQGRRGAERMVLHAPGQELSPVTGAIAIDLPGHGLSDRWKAGPPATWPAWQGVIDAAMKAFGCTRVSYPAPDAGDPVRLFPDLTPDRFGNYLNTAWSITRARRFFAPWHDATPANALDFETGDVTPEALAKDHRALIRASAARAFHLALLHKKGS
jgi:haloalkane dehalogenase